MELSMCTITDSTEVVPGVHLMWLEAPSIAATAQPGQFITVSCEELVLRRPFSIHQVDSGRVAILFKVVGKGTFWLSQQQRGEGIDILGPLGNGFSVEASSRNLLLVAGGIGIAPLIFWAQCVLSRHRVTLIHGAITSAQLYPVSSLPFACYLSPSGGEGEKQSNTQASLPGVRFVSVTEDGSMGRKGMVTDGLADFVNRADQIYACGPVDMYKAMAKLPLPTERNKLKMKKCQVSVEVRLGCGIGACYGCTINTRTGLKQVCRDGPVFELGDILWEEVKV